MATIHFLQMLLHASTPPLPVLVGLLASAHAGDVREYIEAIDSDEAWNLLWQSGLPLDQARNLARQATNPKRLADVVGDTRKYVMVAYLNAAQPDASLVPLLLSGKTRKRTAELIFEYWQAPDGTSQALLDAGIGGIGRAVLLDGASDDQITADLSRADSWKPSGSKQAMGEFRRTLVDLLMPRPHLHAAVADLDPLPDSLRPLVASMHTCDTSARQIRTLGAGTSEDVQTLVQSPIWDDRRWVAVAMAWNPSVGTATRDLLTVAGKFDIELHGHTEEARALYEALGKSQAMIDREGFFTAQRRFTRSVNSAHRRGAPAVNLVSALAECKDSPTIDRDAADLLRLLTESRGNAFTRRLLDHVRAVAPEAADKWQADNGLVTAAVRRPSHAYVADPPTGGNNDDVDLTQFRIEMFRYMGSSIDRQVAAQTADILGDRPEVWLTALALADSYTGDLSSMLHAAEVLTA